MWLDEYQTSLVDKYRDYSWRTLAFNIPRKNRLMMPDVQQTSSSKEFPNTELLRCLRSKSSVLTQQHQFESSFQIRSNVARRGRCRSLHELRQSCEDSSHDCRCATCQGRFNELALEEWKRAGRQAVRCRLNTQVHPSETSPRALSDQRETGNPWRLTYETAESLSYL